MTIDCFIAHIEHVSYFLSGMLICYECEDFSFATCDPLMLHDLRLLLVSDINVCDEKGGYNHPAG